jgi:hypothetical protein
MQPPPARCMGLRVLYFHPAILGPPLVEGRFAGAVDRATPMRCSTPTSRLLLWQDRNDLLSAEPATLHSSVALTVVGPYLNLEEFRGQVRPNYNYTVFSDVGRELARGSVIPT